MAGVKRRSKFINFRQIKGTKLFRTSNLNTASESDIEDLKSLGILALFDLRSDPEVLRDWNAPLGKHYLKLTTKENKRFYTLDAAMRKEILHKDGIESGQPKFGLQYHCNFVDLACIRWALWQSPWYLKPLFVLRYLIDVLFCGYVRFSFPVFARKVNTSTLQESFIDLIDLKGPVMNDVFRLLSTPANCPAALMCSVGKDRTGIISAFIQTICQVDRETIIADFAQSDVELAPVRQQIIDRIVSIGIKAENAYASPGTIRGLLDHIDEKYGSIPEYLESIGFCSMMQEKLRQNVQSEPAD